MINGGFKWLKMIMTFFFLVELHVCGLKFEPFIFVFYYLPIKKKKKNISGDYLSTQING